ncbi:MAG: hypothetical protein ABW022_07515 [Actinoplanes sp.]
MTYPPHYRQYRRPTPPPPPPPVRPWVWMVVGGVILLSAGLFAGAVQNFLR